MADINNKLSGVLSEFEATEKWLGFQAFLCNCMLTKLEKQVNTAQGNEAEVGMFSYKYDEILAKADDNKKRWSI